MLWGFGWLLLAGFIGGWGQARASEWPAGDSELLSYLPTNPVTEATTASQVVNAGTAHGCPKPSSLSTSVIDPGMSDMSDMVVAFLAEPSPALPDALPWPRQPSTRTQMLREPLLRPPAQLG